MRNTLLVLIFIIKRIAGDAQVCDCEKQFLFNVGFKPDHYLTADTDWIAETLKILEK